MPHPHRRRANTENLLLEFDPTEDNDQYRFLRPTCETAQRRPAEAMVASVLLPTGVECVIIDNSPITENGKQEFSAALDAGFDLSKLSDS